MAAQLHLLVRSQENPQTPLQRILDRLGNIVRTLVFVHRISPFCL